MFEQFKYMEVPEIRREYSPSRWVGSPKYKLVTRIRMTCGGGLGGSSWYEYVERLPEIPANQIIEVKRYNGKWIFINTSYIVSAENFQLAIMTLDISEWEAIRGGNDGIKDYYILMDDGRTLNVIS